jgi:FkbM family methyltransferase
MKNLKKFFKGFARSGNISLALEWSGNLRSTKNEIRNFRWKGMRYFYRTNTSDSFVAFECMLHGQRNAYHSKFLPKSNEVRIIVDIGANVGASVLFWKYLYPNSTIYAFEPEPLNFSMLKKNTENLSNVYIFNEALGDKSGSIEMIHSPDFANSGGWSIYQRGAKGGEQRVSVPIKISGDRLTELGIEDIDVLKVDTEGAEKMIIHGLGDLLSRVGYLCGELHGERDFELLDYLDTRGFKVGARKSLKSVLFNFEATSVRV